MPGFVEPGFVVPGFVPFGCAPGLEEDPGAVGVVLGLVLGFGFGLFGFVVDGWELPFGFDGFAPGSVLGAVEPVGGAVVLPVGGCAVLPVGA